MPRAGDSSVIPQKATCEGLLSQISLFVALCGETADAGRRCRVEKFLDQHLIME
jgi:hypothetical protein